MVGLEQSSDQLEAAQPFFMTPCVKAEGCCWCRAGDWGELQGSDAAAMVEVVEHLDPGALLAAGPALLGGLRPKIAVVTTPNIEYNSVRRNRTSVGWECQTSNRMSGISAARLSAVTM